ncbi:glucose dehydrogenase [FAD, quinone]-like [Daktulosphaira vitifoliae]|uniref:glucose dehydrogenase [FAD, quinone]-like n=1 Tax=Daktulosphaira vitifoliae TaxID=58002 RepID=UPI0021A9A8CD|nr:glucose dehydrogenase [FAD, quinone]-like [Daktulosphaira vitifoliae]
MILKRKLQTIFLIYFFQSYFHVKIVLSIQTTNANEFCYSKNYTEPPFLKNRCQAYPRLHDFMTVADILIRSDCHLVNGCRKIVDNLDDTIEEADFIVVGGGVGGSVVASRLSENPEWTVVLLEAGPEQPTAIDIPALVFSALGTKYDWQYVTEPQKNACLITKGVCAWPRGKLLGGTGALSGSMYSRGHRQIYDNWLKAGNRKWGFEDVLPFFMMSENNLNFRQDKYLKYHGQNGPLPVMHPTFMNPVTEIILEAGEELGYSRIDMSDPEAFGFSFAQIMMKNNTRVTIPTAFLRPHLNRKNLKIKINRFVTKLLINPVNKTVYGVEYIDKTNKTHKLIAKKEVILSAGVIGSPHLLMLSGIGPKYDLEYLGIPVVENLKVGYHLQHHVSVALNIKMNMTNNLLFTYESIIEYLNHRTGPISQTGALQASAFLRSDQSNANQPPDIQLFFDGYSPNCENAQVHYGCSKPIGIENFDIRVVNILPRSTGSIKLVSSNPFVRPLINPNYLAFDTDFKVLLSGIKLIKKIINTEAMQKLGAKLDETPVKECMNFNFDTEEYWRCYIKYYTSGENHHSGTCKMGPPSDCNAVVDDELRIHKIKGIRVADASIKPIQPNCNPIAPTIMIAERAAHFIKNTWKINS